MKNGDFTYIEKGWWIVSENKYLDSNGLIRLVANSINKFSPKVHNHTVSEISDYIVDSELSNDSDNPISSSAVNSAINSLKDEFRTALDGIGEYSSLEPKNGDIPKVFIDGAIPTTKDDVLAELTYISSTHQFHAYINIKCQGTSSMKYPKKNFTIKLFKDDARTEKLNVDFKGWGAQCKFCLKANWIDLSHSRNVVSAQLAGDIVKTRSGYSELPELLRTSPNNGMIDGFPIKVYANGIYQGRYTWNIPKDAWMTNMDDSLDNHCILCGENYDGGCFRVAPVIDGSDWSDEVHDVAPDSIKTRWAEVVSFIMNSTDEEFKSGIDNYIDIDSLIDYHIMGIYCCGLDSYGKNQIYLTYDGIKWYASMYDLDSTWGLYWNGETLVNYDYSRDKFEDMVQGRQGNLLFERIEQNFYEDIQNRWIELKNSALSMPNIINRFERFTDGMTTDLIKEDYASTTASGKYSGIPSVAKNNIQQIRNFAAARRSWADEYFDALVPTVRVPCTGITLSVTELSFTSTVIQTITATVTPSDTTDKVVWSSSNEDVATVDNGVVTAVFNGDAVITATCGDFSASCSVSVSGIEEPSIPDNPDVGDTILYSLPSPTTFTGTNYIDTGVSPLATDTPFTIFVDWTNTGESSFVASKHVVLHCMTEANPYPGIVLQYAPAGLVSEFRQGSNISSNSQGADIANADLSNAKVIYRKDADGNITIARCYNENGQIHKNVKQVEYVAVPENVRLGCYQTTLGGTGRFAKGIMNDCKIYNYALSDEEMEASLLS